MLTLVLVTVAAFVIGMTVASAGIAAYAASCYESRSIFEIGGDTYYLTKEKDGVGICE